MAEDRRRRERGFTDHGKETMGRAVGEIVLGGLGTHVAGRALTDQGWPTSRANREAAVEKFDEDLRLIRFGLRDSSFFEYDPENEQPKPVYACFNPEWPDMQDSTPDLTALDDDPNEPWDP